MGIFGWKVAVIYAAPGLTAAVTGGMLIESLRLEDQVEEYIRRGRAAEIPQEELTVKDRMRLARDQAASIARKVVPYVLVGVGIGVIIHNWIPEELVVTLLGTGNPLGVVIATAVGIPMYADFFGAISIAESLLAKGAQLGALLSFMMGVTTLNLPSMIMLRKAVKPKLLTAFIVVCTVGVILVGCFFKAIQALIM